ncbi:hypothetical protein YC2023_070941 [Brassica napus]
MLITHYVSVTCLVFSGDHSLLVSGSQDGSVRVWSLIRLFDHQQRQHQERTLYEHIFDEHTMAVTDIVIDYGGCNPLIVSASMHLHWTLAALCSILVAEMAKFISVP